MNRSKKINPKKLSIKKRQFFKKNQRYKKTAKLIFKGLNRSRQKQLRLIRNNFTIQTSMGKSVFIPVLTKLQVNSRSDVVNTALFLRKKLFQTLQHFTPPAALSYRYFTRTLLHKERTLITHRQRARSSIYKRPIYLKSARRALSKITAHIRELRSTQSRRSRVLSNYVLRLRRLQLRIYRAVSVRSRTRRTARFKRRSYSRRRRYHKRWRRVRDPRRRTKYTVRYFNKNLRRYRLKTHSKRVKGLQRGIYRKRWQLKLTSVQSIRRSYMRRRSAARGLSLRARRSNSRALTGPRWRRRRRGGWLYAGLFGKLRRRAGRRDKSLNVRAHLRFIQKTSVLQGTEYELSSLSRRQFQGRSAIKRALAGSKIARGQTHQTALRFAVRRRVAFKFKQRGLKSIFYLSQAANSNRLDFKHRRVVNSSVLQIPNVIAAPNATYVSRKFVSHLLTSASNKPRSAESRQTSGWQSARLRQRLLIQGVLTAGTLLSQSQPQLYSGSVRLVLENKLFRNNLFSSNYKAVNAASGSKLTAYTLTPNYTRHRINNTCKQASRKILSFLKNAPERRRKVILSLNSTAHNRYKELRVYSLQPRLRLPHTTVTRNRRRRGGHVLFTRNSLKQPQSLLGKKNQQLPPLNAHVYFQHKYGGQLILPNDLLQRRQFNDKHPRFWKRPPSRANLKAIYGLRSRDLRRSRYKSMRLRRPLKARLTALVADTSRGVVPILNTKSSKYLINQSLAARSKLAKIVINKNLTKHRSRSHLHGSLSRTTQFTAAIKDSRPVAWQKTSGLWHARSVRVGLDLDRALSAWSPLLRSKVRRWLQPRLDGRPLSRKILGFKASRERRLANARRLERNLPQIKYIDYEATKLQFYLGSAGSTGYTRLRRTFRHHTDHRRWWQPVKRAISFAHPFSRRSLTAKYYYKQTFDSAWTAERRELNNSILGSRGRLMTMKFPGRTIPWRNFRYPRPRKGTTPRTLRRWTYTIVPGQVGYSEAPMRELILKRSARNRHVLSNFVSNYSGWNHRRWAAFENLSFSTVTAAQFTAALRSISTRVWSDLASIAGSPANAAAVQHDILLRFRSWLSTQNTTLSVRDACAFLTTLILSSTKANVFIKSTNHQRNKSMLRATALHRRIKIKHDHFFSLQELPKVLSAAKEPFTPTPRDNSIILKHWLHGAGRLLQNNRWSYTSTDRSRYIKNASTAIFRWRVRFPAASRQRKSYESILQAFVRKVGPARLRRASALRFRQALPKITSDFRQNVLASVASYGISRRRNLARKLSCVAYLSAPWREILNYQQQFSHTLTTTSPHASSKLRFMSLPCKTFVARSRQQAYMQETLHKNPMYATRACILRQALRRRRTERLIFDLRRSIMHRRIPKDTAPHPRKLRRTIRRQRARRYRRQRARLNQFTQPQTSWLLHRFGAVGERTENILPRVITNNLPSGELFSTKPLSVRYNKRAFYGFSVKAVANYRLRRKPHKDSCRRYRRYGKRRRLGMRAAMRRIRHWSETKGSRSVGSYTLARRAYFARKIFHSPTAGFNSLRSFKRRSFTSKRLARFMLRRRTPEGTSSAGLGLITNRAVAASTLLSTSSTTRNQRFNRLTKLSSIAKLRYRAVKQRAIFSPKRHYCVKNLTQHATLLSGFENSLALIHFQKPITQVLKSVAAKKNDAAADLAFREERYKITAQYLESLTAFIPEIINHMLSKKIINKSNKISYVLAQRLIRNIYWSLRVYLNVDPFDTRFLLRDKKPSARLRLLEEITDLSLTQDTQQPQRAQFRYRFQPGRVLLAANTKRFRSDWLRAFFPDKHALYQEDADDYGLFLFKTKDIRRLRLTGYSLDSWKTAHSDASHESRARQLFTRKYSRNTPRFETMLQTTRRVPCNELSPFIAPLPIFRSFFQRQFSTAAGRNLSMLSAWIHRRKRFIAFDGKWRTVAPVAVVQARDNLISSLESRGRAGYIAAVSAINSTLLDYRFVRAKSPRNRQYLLRNLNGCFPELSAYGFNKRQRLAPAKVYTTTHRQYWTRMYRRAIYSSGMHTDYSFLTAKSSLQHSRRVYNLRRTHRIYAKRRPATIFSNPKRRSALRTLAIRNRRGLSKKGALKLGAQTLSGITTPKLRSAQLRSHSTYYNLLPVISNKAVFYTRSAAIIKNRHMTLRRKIRLNASRRTRFWPLFRVKSGKVYTKFKLQPAHMKTFRRNAVYNYVVGANAVKKPASQRRFFQNEAARQLMRGYHLAATCGMYSKLRSNTPFDIHRGRLWNRLTLRWRKKYRTGRYWLRDTSHWLRDPWLSQIVGCDMSLRPDKFGGELRARQQQVGEYVPEVDDRGRDIPEAKSSTKERHAFSKRPVAVDKGVESTATALKGPFRGLTYHRLQISKIARRKPIPAMWLANYEYKDVIREHKENKAKSVKQRADEEAIRVKAYWERKASNLPEEKPKRTALKHPANLWLPRVIWKEIARRVRKFEWRESDQVFYRRGYRNAFRFYHNERNTLPWLEPLMYTRATYSTRLHEFRRRQYPKEQKKYKWLQRVRRSLYAVKRARYIRFRSWRQLRRYNQKLHYSLFNLPDRNASRRHFKKINNRSRPAISGFVSASTGLTNRLDVALMQLRIAPTIYWSRIVTEFGLVRVNGIVASTASQRLQPADHLQLDWDRIARFQHFFKPYLNRREAYARKNRQLATTYPTNFAYHPGTRTFIYKHAPDESDLRNSNRIHSSHLRWFKLDSV